ncbi:MAG: response regulator [Deltaproteobacteria bacterium]
MNQQKAEKAIRGKRVLIVDDEQDVLDSLTELLQMCKIDSAASFQEAKQFLETTSYDIAVLDIMGVNGYELLEIAKSRKIPALMFTARALTEQDLKKSAEEGASYYAPKDKICDIALFIADVLEAQDKKKNPWVRWYDRLGGFYEQKFVGSNWREKEREFLRKIGIPEDKL